MAASASIESREALPSAPATPVSGNPADLLDTDWAWQVYCREFGEQQPEQPTVQVLEHTSVPGRRAKATYEAEWPEDVYLPNERFTLQQDAGEPVQVFRYPDDPELPGLARASDPETAMALVKRYVMSVPPRRIRVETIRYRPGGHAVLRHRLGRARFYVRAMKPDAMTSLWEATELIIRSSFAVPRVAGYWPEGAVVWTSEIPGDNLRQYIRAGGQPDPEVLLSRLESLWAVPRELSRHRPFNLSGRYRGARREIKHAVRDHDDARRSFNRAVKVLDPFNESWTPVVTAHNDFYDDQLLILPDGRVVLVDFEEAGAGDPMLDVGNFLSHLRWSAAMGTSKRFDAKTEYHRIFREAALRRFGWDPHELALREAICLFRTCVFPAIRPKNDSLQKLAAGLSLVNETLS